jgi:hypothetical protein
MRCDKSLLDDVFLQPWFLPQESAIALRDLLPPAYKHKMGFYFEDYGCLKCGKKSVPYGSNAMCKICVQHVKLRFLWAIKRRWTASPHSDKPRTFKRMADAQQMLEDLARFRRPALQTRPRQGLMKSSRAQVLK